MNRSLAFVLFLTLFPLMANAEIAVVERPGSGTNAHYLSNRPPLEPSALIKLPVGAVRPRGWLRENLLRQSRGLTGHLPEISAWLQKPGNAWLSPDGRGEWGWEEVPYWLKGYGDIAYLLDDPAMIAEARVWLEGALNSQRPDGNFGPVRTFKDDGSQDFWANMIMLCCLQSHHEYTGDPRVIELMTRYFKHQLSVPDRLFLTHYWQKMRGGDNLHSVHWLYNRTGEPFLLELAAKIHRNTADWRMPGALPNWHNVNIAQGFREPATWSLQSHDPGDLRAAYDNFFLVRKLYGQVPGGMYGSDEISRPGFDDPRQGIETCGIVEQMLSDELLLAITADPFWADHCENVAFNALPAALMPDMKALRYFSAPNLPQSDAANHNPGIFNQGAMFNMNPLSNRCCQHNHSHGWAYFAEHLFMATPDNGLAAAIYAPGEVTAKVGDGAVAHIVTDTNYPFEEQVRLSLGLDRSARFPLYLRVPAWCEKPAVSVNGEAQTVIGASGKWLRLEREWRDGDRVELTLPMTVRVKRWTANHDSASVDFGPLTFSLKIAERYERQDPREHAQRDSKWPEGLDPAEWPAFEIFPQGAWNYGLSIPVEQPQAAFTLERRPWPADDFPFAPDSAPLVLHARGRRIPNWTLDRYGLCAPLQNSPVFSAEPEEEIELIPMGAARLRITAFPVVTDKPTDHRWRKSWLPGWLENWVGKLGW